ncbi:MAG: DNA repair exonuclease, partial [Rhodospirillales bacterium]|nr:DNA repair exonuclease [Rhodospirillales bacterium]
AADIHLDSPLAGLHARGDIPAEIIQGCTRRAFQAMIDLAIAEDVAFVVIAGDLYDGDWKDFSTGLFFASQMRRLNRPCFLLRGNHDAQSVITRSLNRLPDNVHEFSSRTCQSIALAELGVALHGHSFPNRAVPEDLSAGYPAPAKGLLNIGVLHTSAEDPGGLHDRYAPCTAAALALKGYDYWALGHIHERRVLQERPWIVFPGNLQGRHVQETGAKGCTLVTVEDGRIVAAEHRSVDVLRWALLEVDATGADLATLTDRIGRAVTPAIAAADGRPLLARLVVTGETDLHERLRGDHEGVAATARDAADAAGGTLHPETVRIRTRAPARGAEERLAPLRTAFAAGLDDPESVAALLAHLAKLRAGLPPDLQATVEIPLDEAALRAFADDAWALAASALEEPRA